MIRAGVSTRGRRYCASTIKLTRLESQYGSGLQDRRWNPALGVNLIAYEKRAFELITCFNGEHQPQPYCATATQATSKGTS